MKLHDLKPQEGARKKRKRVGRGQASGLGKTAGRGMDGQKARSGGGVRLGFEGGQTPLYRRLPKRGFNNSRFATKYVVVNLDMFNTLEENEIDVELLLEKKLVKKEFSGLKVLGRGELNRAITVRAAKFSESAKKKIEEAGGKAEVI